MKLVESKSSVLINEEEQKRKTPEGKEANIRKKGEPSAKLTGAGVNCLVVYANVSNCTNYFLVHFIQSNFTFPVHSIQFGKLKIGPLVGAVSLFYSNCKIIKIRNAA